MPPTDIESDPLFVLLTDALRAGPGSAQWQEALAALQPAGGQNDEHRLILEARENLEKGREYREVRAGAGFTRKLMAEIDTTSQRGGPSTIPTATIVAILCGLVVLGAAGYLIHHLANRPVSLKQQIDELQADSDRFVDTVATTTFNGAQPEGWMPIGALRLNMADGLRPRPAPDSTDKNQGGGIARITPLPAGKSFAVDVTVHVGQSSPSELLEVFVSTDPNFSPDKGTSSRDLVWQLRGTDQQVLLSGSGKLPTPPALHEGDVVRLIVSQDVAIVETVSPGNKPQRLWAGPHDLGAGPRYIGVRFLQTGTAGTSDMNVRQIKITTPPG